jgi:CHRD domain/Domain of unknown function (DUF4397)/S-layer homology domain
MRRLALVVALTVVASLTTVAPAVAQADEFGTVNFINGLPGNVVDVYIEDELVLEDRDYESINPLVLPVGDLAIEVFSAGDDPAADTPIVTGDVTVTEGLNATLVAHLSATGEATLTVFANDVSTLDEGDARVVVRHTAATGPVDVLAGGSPIIEGLANPNEAQLDLPAGDYSVTVNDAGTDDVLVGPVDLTLVAGTSYLVHAVGDPATGFLLVVQTIEGLNPDAQLWAVMDGTEEVPPVDTGAAGVATFEVSEDGASVTFKVIAWYLEDITMGHIHIGQPGVNGPIVSVLVDFAPLDATSGETRNGLLGEGTITGAEVTAVPEAGFDGSIGALVRAMRSEGSYANIHTVAYPSGEIRGQITTLPNGVEDRFTDDEGSVHEANIDIIAAADITLGCDEAEPTLFCPTETVTRGQMASFIQRALNLPAGEDPGFTDIAGNEHEDAIWAIAQAGITIGCEDGTMFCPNVPLTRDQMASFLARAFGLSGGTSPFTDIAGNTHEDNIVAIYEAGITQGCTATEYCPRDPVLRGQMASFLARSLGWGE